MSPAAALFWALAALSVVLSMRVQVSAARTPTEQKLRQARSQRLDDRLALAIMLAAILCDETSLTGWLYLRIKQAVVQAMGHMPNLIGIVYLVGTIALAWLVGRSMQRLLLVTGRE